MTSENRRFTFGMLEFRKFIISDYIYLGGFFLVVLTHTLNALYHVSIEARFLFTLVVAFAMFMVICGPFVLRFRNVYFTALWLIFCGLFMLNNFLLSWTPFVLFLFYQLLRAWFWKRNKREWIPWIVVKGGMIRHRSVFEKAGGVYIDKKYTYVFFIFGLLIFFGLFLLTFAVPGALAWI